MHIDFDPSGVDWTAFANHGGSVIQYGGYDVFHGIPFQRGAGVGSVFRSLFRYLMPIGKQIGATVGREGLETGNRVLSNVLQGKDLKETLAAESQTGLKNLLEKASSKIDEQKGRGAFDFKRYQRRTNASTVKKGKQKHINKIQSTFGPASFPTKRGGGKTKAKRLRVDSLGTY